MGLFFLSRRGGNSQPGNTEIGGEMIGGLGGQRTETPCFTVMPFSILQQKITTTSRKIENVRRTDTEVICLVCGLVCTGCLTKETNLK